MIMDHIAERVKDPELQRKLQIMQVGTSSKTNENTKGDATRKRDKKRADKRTLTSTDPEPATIGKKELKKRMKTLINELSNHDNNVQLANKLNQKLEEQGLIIPNRTDGACWWGLFAHTDLSHLTAKKLKKQVRILAKNQGRIDEDKAKAMEDMSTFADEIEQALTADFLYLTIKITGYYEGTKSIVTHQVGTGKTVVHIWRHNCHFQRFANEKIGKRLANCWPTLQAPVVTHNIDEATYNLIYETVAEGNEQAIREATNKKHAIENTHSVHPT